MWHCGELLAKVERGNAERDEKERRAGGVPPSNRKTAAKSAGLSERQRKTALRVHSIPRRRFDVLIEAAPPAAIADQKGRQRPV